MLGLGWVDQAVLAVLYGLVGLGRLELPSRPLVIKVRVELTLIFALLFNDVFTICSIKLLITIGTDPTKIF